MLSIIRTGVGKVTTTNESIGEGWPGFLRTRFGPGHAALVAAINRPRPAPTRCGTKPKPAAPRQGEGREPGGVGKTLRDKAKGPPGIPRKNRESDRSL